MAVLATETWTGANGAAWPAQWATTPVTGGPVNIQNNAGSLGASTASWTIGGAAYLSGMASTVDIDITVDMAFTSLSQQWCGMFVRIPTNPGGTWPGDGHFLGIDPSIANSMYVARRNSGAETNLSSGTFGGSWTANTFRRIRFQVLGNNFKVKVWAPAAAEPTAWAWEGTDTTFAGRSGRLFFTSSNGLNTAAKSWRLDNLTVTDGVTITAPAHTAPLSLSASGLLTLSDPRVAFSGSLTLGGSGQVTIPDGKPGYRGLPMTLSGSGALTITPTRVNATRDLTLSTSGTLTVTPTRVVVPRTGSIPVNLGASGVLTWVGIPGFTDDVALSGSGTHSRLVLAPDFRNELLLTGHGHLRIDDPLQMPIYVWTGALWRPTKLYVWNGRAWLPIRRSSVHTY